MLLSKLRQRDFIDEALYYLHDDHDDCMIAEYQISNDYSTSSGERSEVAESGVDGIEDVAKNIEDHEVKGHALNS